MKKVSRIEYCASFEPLQSGMGQDGESKILFPTMKPLDSDKKVSKEVSAPAEAAQTAPVVEEKLIFPMFRSSLCSKIRSILTPSPRAISVP